MRKRILFFFKVALLLLGLLLWAPSKVYGQSTGFKFFKSYTSKEYEEHNINWAVLQDKRRIIYVANNSGLMEFDGISWRKIAVPNWTVRSMAIDDDGTIYVGGQDEIGFLVPDSKGTLQYESLLNYLDDNKKNFAWVWRTHSTKEGIYFRTSKFLFRWRPNSKQIKVWEPEPGHAFKFSFTREGIFFIHQRKVGLMQIANDSLKLIPGDEKFAAVEIFTMAQYDSEKLLIGTLSNGFYIYDGLRVVPFPTEVDDYLRKKELAHSIRLSSGDFALATLRGGLVIIDPRGRQKEIFNKDSGLQDDNVKYVFQDSQGNLWLALSKGIAKIEYVSPFSVYDERSKLPGNVQSVVKHQNHLYVGTDRGLFFLASPFKFRPAAGISSDCRDLLSIKDSLLVAATDGVCQVKNNSKQRITKNRSYVLLRSDKDKNRVWVGTSQGLFSLFFKDGQWVKERKFENITQAIKTIVEDRKGSMWLGTQTKGVLKVDFPGDGVTKDATGTHYHTSQGLPSGPVRVYWAAGHVMFATDEGIFRFDESKKVFIPDATLGKEFAGGPEGKIVFRIAADKDKNVWLHSYPGARNIQVILKPDGTFEINKKPFLRLPGIQVNTIYPDPGGDTVWFAGNDGLIRYDIKVKKNYRLDFPTLIRKVVVNGKLVFNGYKSKRFFPIVPYKDRNLRFEFAAPFFEAETRTRYQSFLEGYETDWSAFTSETRKDYTNLDAGVYTFRVRARNVYENLSKEAVFKFKILPPWYKTWWAFAVYILAGFLLVFLIVKWRSGKLQREKQKLEQIVKERTKEIKDKNLQLEDQSEKLKEMDKVKSRFFANISHEFRTPLTLIMGPLEQFISKTPDKEQQKQLHLMLRNSQRLLNLINQLLDLSKFDSGKMKLQAYRQNIIPFLRTIIASFDTIAAKNQLDLTLHSEEENITLYFEPEKLEEVFFNLLSNAVKFTPQGGKITVAVTRNPGKEDNFPFGSLEISVADTGPGIARDQLAHIFDRFYQSDSTDEHRQKGSGIGLSIVKELVELHHGTIAVRSGEGKGTEFIIRLPMGDAHLKPEEMVEPAKKPYQHKSPGEIPAFNRGEEADTAAGEENFDPLKPGKDIILVVEDSADVRDYIRGSLEPLYTVVEAKDGREGVKKALEIIPDLIISDIMMPEKDGYELCRRLKNDIKTSHVPVILLTAKASEENIIQGLETKADDYITKPFSTKILCARIKNLIDLRRQLQQKLSREMALQPAEISVSSMDQNFIKELQETIETNLSDTLFGVEQLGKKLYMSRASLYRKIFALSGESPREFIKTYRLKRGAQLLKANFGNVTEVAFEVGFSSTAYFTKCFKDKFHQLPHTFQAAEGLGKATDSV